MNLGALSLQRSNSHSLCRPRKPGSYRPLFETYLTSAVGRKCQETLAIRTMTTYEGNMASNDPAVEQSFSYTSGRWLWDEEQQLRDRYKAFDVPQLQTLAAQAIGSKGCDSIAKLAEGGFNKVFRLKMDDEKTVLARIPNPNAGPAFYTTASEVATMEFVRVRDTLQIPVPRILGWSADSRNSAGSEYIFMEEASGTQLATEWDGLNSDAKFAIMREVVAIEKKLLSVSFLHHGSIYFASDAVEGAVPAQITSEATSEMKELVAKKSTIGPSVAKISGKRSALLWIYREGLVGSSPEEYATSVGLREVEWIKKYAVPKPADDAMLVSTAQNNPQAHINLLEKYLNIVPCLMDVERSLSRPTLWHSDLHASNLFVENNVITAIIDWQGSWVGPLFLQAQPSPLVDYQGSILLNRPGNFDNLDPEQQVQIKRQIFKATLFQLYLMETQRRNPVIAEAFHLDHGKTRRLPVELARNTWDDEIVSFRESLINVERHWKELHYHSDCPYHFTEDELRSHAADAEGWNEVQDFFDSIDSLVERDGWTHPATFDAAFDFFANLRKLGLEGRKGEERERDSIGRPAGQKVKTETS